MIHVDHPFADDPSVRDPVRRFRGRLTAPVTIVTAGSGSGRTGLTVSSLFVVEGEPGQIRMLVSPTADLWDRSAETGRFVVHICASSDRGMADVFAGLRPSPGGIFAGVDVTQTKWGPAIDLLENRAYCRFIGREESGYSGLITAAFDNVELDDLTDPLVYFRGSYRSFD